MKALKLLLFLPDQARSGLIRPDPDGTNYAIDIRYPIRFDPASRIGLPDPA